jgi:hypothetical protein
MAIKSSKVIGRLAACCAGMPAAAAKLAAADKTQAKLRPKQLVVMLSP